MEDVLNPELTPLTFGVDSEKRDRSRDTFFIRRI